MPKRAIVPMSMQMCLPRLFAGRLRAIFERSSKESRHVGEPERMTTRNVLGYLPGTAKHAEPSVGGFSRTQCMADPTKEHCILALQTLHCCRTDAKSKKGSSTTQNGFRILVLHNVHQFADAGLIRNPVDFKVLIWVTGWMHRRQRDRASRPRRCRKCKVDEDER